MIKHLKILARFWRMGWMNILAYKQNALVGFVIYSHFLLIHLLLVEVVFNVSGINEILGFDKYQIMLVMVLAEAIWALMFVFIWGNVTRVTWDYHSGYLDYDLTKPVNHIFTMSLWRIHGIDLIHFVLYMLLAVYFYARSGMSFGWEKWLTFGFIMLASLVVMYLMSWSIALITFFSERFTVLWEMFLNITEINNFPRQVYPRAMQSILIYLFPVFLIINPVYDLMAGEFGWSEVGRMVLMIGLLVTIYINMWKFGLRKYNSAN